MPLPTINRLLANVNVEGSTPFARFNSDPVSNDAGSLFFPVKSGLNTTFRRHMNRAGLSKRVQRAKCRVFGWQDASIDGRRAVVAAVIQSFDDSESADLIEPSLSRKTNRTPDIVLINPEIGVNVLEVKGIELQRIESIEPGGIVPV